MNTDLPPPTLDGEPTPRLSPFATVDSAPTKETLGEALLSLPAIKTGKNAKDITGQRFGRLAALRPVGRTPRSQVKWLCSCDCGRFSLVPSADLIGEHSVSCGCYRAELSGARKAVNITGARFGRLTAVAPTGRHRLHLIEWHCTCDCGGSIDTTVNKLRTGTTKSCGCLQVAAAIANLRPVNESGMMVGAGNPRWNPELTAEDRLAFRADMPGVRRIVFFRDDYTCLCCGCKRGGNLNAHHIQPWYRDKELRYDPDNLVTLCEKCHRSYHKQYPAKDSNEETFMLWFRQQKISQK